MHNHLLCKLFPEVYTSWCRHRETLSGKFIVCSYVFQENSVNEDPMQELINDAFECSIMCANEESFSSSTEQGYEGEGGISNSQQGSTAGVKEFYDLLRDGEQPLYDGCTIYSKLSFLAKLYHIKCFVSN